MVEGTEMRAVGLSPGARDARDSSYHEGFVIAEESGAWCPGWVNLFAMDSPSLTADPAIRHIVLDMQPSLMYPFQYETEAQML